MDEVNRPEGVTALALKECGEWLCLCLRLGWKKPQLDELENVWWKYHDRFGILLKPEQCKAAPMTQV